MNPQNHFSYFQPPRTVPYFPNPNPQSFPSQNKTLIIPLNFPPSLLPSLQNYLSTPHSQPMVVPGGSHYPVVMQYPSIVSPLKFKTSQTNTIKVGSSVLFPASGRSPYFSKVPHKSNTHNNYKDNIRPSSACLNAVKNEKIGNGIQPKNQQNPPLITKNQISGKEKEKIQIAEKFHQIRTQGSIAKNQEQQRLEKGYSIASEEQKKEEQMESCLSFLELEQMKLKHQGFKF